MLFCAGCGTNQTEVQQGTGNNQPSTQDSYRLQHYIIEGRKLFNLHCSKCHQEDGTGLGRLIPPLKEADFLQKNASKLPCIIKYGMAGEIYVNGNDYKQPMPGNQGLTNLEIAEIATYVLNNWAEQKKLVPVKSINDLLRNCDNLQGSDSVWLGQ